MADSSKQETVTRLGIRWEVDEWDRVEKATAKKSELEHLDLNETDFVRTATRLYTEQYLGPRQQEASAA